MRFLPPFRQTAATCFTATILTDEDVFTAFFDTLLHSRALDAQIVPDASVSPDDRVVILSTCYAGDYSKRFWCLQN